MVWFDPLSAEKAIRLGQIPLMPRRSHKCGTGRPRYRLRDAYGRREKLDISATSYCRVKRLDGGHQSAFGLDLGSGQGLEGVGSGVCGE